MATHSIKNISSGIRGFNAESGLVEIAPGQTAEGVEISDAELKSSARTGWFEIDGSTDAPDTGPADDLDTTVPKLRDIAKAEGVDLSGLTGKADIQGAIRAARTVAAERGGDAIDDMDDATLLTTAAALTGKPEAELQGTPRDELLRLARGDA